MTIHHDKAAYGKIASGNEELTEKQIAEMLTELNAFAEETEEEDHKEKLKASKSEKI